MMNWTITYNGVEKTFADWGLSQPVRTLLSHGQDEFTFTADGANADAAAAFPFRSTLLVRRDRRQASDGTWSDGKPWFTGRVIQVPRQGNPKGESMAYKLAGPWWYLENLVFEQPYNFFKGFTVPNDPTSPPILVPDGTSSHLFLGLNINTVPWSYLSTGQQIVEILQWVLKQFTDTGGTVPFQIGTVTPAVQPPIDEVKDITCAEAVRKMLRWSPDAVTWFDYTTTPPTFHCGRRADLAVLGLDINAGVLINSVRVNARYDLQAPYVLVKYESNTLIQGQSSLALSYDIYPGGNGIATATQPALPANADSRFAGLTFTVNLQGIQTTETKATLAVEPINHTSLDWWLDKHPDLVKHDSSNPSDTSDVANIIFDPKSEPPARLPVAPIGGVPPADKGYVSQLTKGQLADWMTFGSQRVTLSCQVQVTSRNGGSKRLHKLTYQCLSTNAAGGTYQKQAITTPQEPTPIGLAKFLYDATSVLQFEGSATLQEEECSGQVSIGNLLNLTGGALAEWSAMQALIQRVQENIETGQTVVEFGPPRELSAGELVDLLQVNRSRFIFTSVSMRAAGTSASGGDSSVSLGTDTPEKNSTGSGCYYDSFVVSDEPDASKALISLSIEEDSGNPVIVMDDQSDPNSGSVEMDLGDVFGSDGQGHQLIFRELDVCENGVPKKKIFLCSESYDPPA